LASYSFLLRGVAAALAAGLLAAGSMLSAADELPYGLKSGRPYAGVTLDILSVVTPQFEGLRLRDSEFTELTGIDTEWTFVPFTALQEKVASVGVRIDTTHVHLFDADTGKRVER
jgi:hypothetical protein